MSYGKKDMRGEILAKDVLDVAYNSAGHPEWQDAEVMFLLESRKKGMTYTEISEEWDSHFPWKRTKAAIKKKYKRLRDVAMDNIDDAVKEKKEYLIRKKVELEVLREEKERSKTEILIDNVKDSIETMEFLKPTMLTKKPKTQFQDEPALLLFSDSHCGEEVRREDTGGLAEYNFEKFKLMLRSLAYSVIEISEIQSKSYGIPELIVAFLGDLVTGAGNIYRGQTARLEMNVIEQCLEVADEVSQFLVWMTNFFPKIRVIGVTGNHGRVGKKNEYKQYVNWDYVVYKFIETRLKDYENITFDFPKSFWHVEEINGHKILFIHGDDIKMWNQVPWYGIERALLRFQELLRKVDKQFDYACLAHFHQAGQIDRIVGEAILNGNWMGTTDWTMKTMHMGSEPSQWFLGLAEKSISWRYKIDLLRHSEAIEKGMLEKRLKEKA